MPPRGAASSFSRICKKKDRTTHQRKTETLTDQASPQNPAHHHPRAPTMISIARRSLNGSDKLRGCGPRTRQVWRGEGKAVGCIPPTALPFLHIMMDHEVTTGRYDGPEIMMDGGIIIGSLATLQRLIGSRR